MISKTRRSGGARTGGHQDRRAARRRQEAVIAIATKTMVRVALTPFAVTDSSRINMRMNTSVDECG